MNRPVIEMKGVYARYDETIVLENITLDVSRGEILAVVGPNGSGKSTLVKLVLGLMKPWKGTVTVFDHPAHIITGSGRTAYLPQSSQHDLSFPVSAFDVVAMALKASKKFFEGLTTEDKEKIDYYLELVELEEMRGHHFGSLSGGQKQRVLIARALVLEPELLVLDEPSTGLDSVSQDSFYQLLTRLRDEKKISILMVSHDIGVVSTIVDRLACIKRKIHFHGKPTECNPSDDLAAVFGNNIHILKHDELCPTCQEDE